MSSQLPVCEFLSTPSARRATGPRSPPARCTPISIHALREEGDQIPATAHYAPIHFYPRPPRGGRRGRYQVRQRHFEFLSTPSARRATLISPLSRSFSYRFLSTPSARRATCRRRNAQNFASYFYPRPPRGGRPFIDGVEVMDGVFLSTPSARRATGRPSVQAVVVAISIHALREEGDVATLVMAVPSGHFYPRPPRGGRPGPQLVLRCSRAISIHALREEGDYLYF